MYVTAPQFITPLSFPVGYMCTELESAPRTVNVTVGTRVCRSGKHSLICPDAALYSQEFGAPTCSGSLNVDLTSIPAQSRRHGSDLVMCVALSNTAGLLSETQCATARVEELLPALPSPVFSQLGALQAPSIRVLGQSNMSVLQVFWTPWAPLSGVNNYTLRVTSWGSKSSPKGPDARPGPGPFEVISEFTIPAGDLQSVIVLPVQARLRGWTFYVTVGAISKAGNAVYSTTGGIVLDDTAPLVGSLALGQSIIPAGQRLLQTAAPGSFVWTNDSSKLDLSWVIDERESAIGELAIGVSSCGNLPDDIKQFTAAPSDASSFSVTGLQLPSGTANRFCVALRVTNVAGITSTSVSAPIRVDNSPPYATGVVIRDGFDVGPYQDPDFSGSSTVVSASWSNAFG